jgi:hypothetical protein
MAKEPSQTSRFERFIDAESSGGAYHSGVLFC